MKKILLLGVAGLLVGLSGGAFAQSSPITVIDGSAVYNAYSLDTAYLSGNSSCLDGGDPVGLNITFSPTGQATSNATTIYTRAPDAPKTCSINSVTGHQLDGAELTFYAHDTSCSFNKNTTSITVIPTYQDDKFSVTCTTTTKDKK